MWHTDEIQPLGRSSLLELIHNRIPAVRLKAFADEAEIDGLVNELQTHACRTNSIKQVTRLGISQYEQGVRASKDNYFQLAKQLNKEFSRIFSSSFSPVQRLIDELTALDFDAGVMSEPGIGSYFAGNGKLRSGRTPIHVDYSPQDSDGWAIADGLYQLAWNLYLRVPPQGGELLVWDKYWEPEDDVYQVEGNYFYTEAVVNGAQMLRVKVHPGEVIMINSRNYHAVEEVEDRLAFGSFISVFDDLRLRLWS